MPNKLSCLLEHFAYRDGIVPAHKQRHIRPPACLLYYTWAIHFIAAIDLAANDD
jgi:hypothetical protein